MNIKQALFLVCAAILAAALIAVGCGGNVFLGKASASGADEVEVADDGEGGSLVDDRDGQTYRTVKIGSFTWMAENLNYNSGGSLCFDNDESNCIKYGRLYDFDAAKTACPAGWQLPSSYAWDKLVEAAGGVEKLDTKSGHYIFEAAGEKLKSKTGWSGYRGESRNGSDTCLCDYGGKGLGGTDELGFSALGGGHSASGRDCFACRDGLGFPVLPDGYGASNCFACVGNVGDFWSATESAEGNSGEAYRYSLTAGDGNVRERAADKKAWFSVRCVKDYKKLPLPTVSPKDPSGLHDQRDGQMYQTVKIGRDTWMAENLDYEMGHSWCYDDADSNCVKYGRLYDFATATAVCPSGWHLPRNREWQTLVDFVTGINEVYDGAGDLGRYDIVGRKLKSKTGWRSYKGDRNGSDIFGFSALPGGSRINIKERDPMLLMEEVGRVASFWSATWGGRDKAITYGFVYDYDGGGTGRGGGGYGWGKSRSGDRGDIGGGSSKGNGHSVRCVKDSGGASAPTDSAPAAAPPPSHAAIQEVAIRRMPPLTDSRDGRVYRTVSIGGRVWMAENLNFKADSSYCYGDADVNCAKYGRLYDWKAANVACPRGWHLPSQDEWDKLLVASGDGWSAGNRLKSKAGWNECNYKTEKYAGNGGSGTDDYGFSALGGGIRKYTEISHSIIPPSPLSLDVGDYGHFWSATEEEAADNDNRHSYYPCRANCSYAYYRYVSHCLSDVGEGLFEKETGLSVRCVKE